MAHPPRDAFEQEGNESDWRPFGDRSLCLTAEVPLGGNTKVAIFAVGNTGFGWSHKASLYKPGGLSREKTSEAPRLAIGR